MCRYVIGTNIQRVIKTEGNNIDDTIHEYIGTLYIHTKVGRYIV